MATISSHISVNAGASKTILFYKYLFIYFHVFNKIQIINFVFNTKTLFLFLILLIKTQIQIFFNIHVMYI